MELSAKNIELVNLGYIKAQQFAKSHYENFPVVSILIKKELRKHIAIVYWFARTADDLADEGNVPADIKLENLNAFEEKLNDILKGKLSDEFDWALYNTISEKKLSIINFYNLLKAFKQDTTRNRYKNFDEILDYCSNSANPVGRIILEIYGIKNEETFRYSDSICTALQLTNFYQDVSIDVDMNRLYIPIDELEAFNIKDNIESIKENEDKFKEIIKSNVERAKYYFYSGKPLLNYLTGMLKYEIKWTIYGGMEVLKKIEKNDYNVLYERATLSKKNFVFLLIKSFFKNESVKRNSKEK